MRADRLVSMVLLLRQRGRLTAKTLARELEVSTRTVLRDIEALSAAGIPVYAHRGQYGGFALLPGFRDELMGLNHDEALALLTAGSGSGRRVFGLGSALASAMRKVVDALPEGHQVTATDSVQRFLIEPAQDLLSRRPVFDETSDEALVVVRRAVLTGHQLSILYTASGETPKWRTVDPIGLVTVRDRVYLLATKAGKDRTYRMSRISAAKVLVELAKRPNRIDLEQIWRERSERFLSTGHLAVLVRVDSVRREELIDTALGVHSEEHDSDGWLRLNVIYQDLRHAEWALWQLGTSVEALSPPSLRTSLRKRAAAVAASYIEHPD